MTSQPNDEASKAAQEFERGRSEMERGWQLRQQNVLPLATAWNRLVPRIPDLYAGRSTNLLGGTPAQSAGGKTG